MRNRCSLVRLIVFILCLGLVWPLESLNAAPLAKQRRRASRAKSTKKRSARSRRSRRAPAAPKAASFDKVMTANNGLLNEASDATQAGGKIDETTLRAHVRFLSDDLLEGRGPGARGGILAAKYIASQFEALGLEPATASMP